MSILENRPTEVPNQVKCIGISSIGQITEPSTLSDNFCNFYVVMLSLDSNLFIGSDTINSHGMEYPMRVQKYKVVLSAKQRKRLKALSQRGQVSARLAPISCYWQTKTGLKGQ